MDNGNRRKRIDYSQYDQFNYKLDGKTYIVWIIDGNEPNEWWPCLVGPVYLDSWSPCSDDTVDGEENVYFISRKIEKSYRVYFLQFEILKRTRFKDSEKPCFEALLHEINSVHGDELCGYLVYRRQYFWEVYLTLLGKDHYLREECMQAIRHLDCEIKKITR